MTQEILSILNVTGTSAILHIGPDGEFAKQLARYCQDKHGTFFSFKQPLPQSNTYFTLTKAIGADNTICIDAGQEWSVLYELLLHCEECRKEYGIYPIFVLYNIPTSGDLNAITTEFLMNTRYTLFLNGQKSIAIMIAPLLLSQNTELSEFLQSGEWKKEKAEERKANHKWALLKAEAHNRFLQSLREKEGLDFSNAWEIERGARQELKDHLEIVKDHLEAVENDRKRIMQSKSWKLTAWLRNTEAWLRRLLCNQTTEENLNRIQENPQKKDRREAPVVVVIPCHNYGKYLTECIESVLNQTRPPQEIIVVDDASTDNTSEVAKAYAHQRVQYLRGEWNSVGKARNAGAASTTAPYLIFLDADDILASDYIEKCLEEMQDPTVGIAYGYLIRFGDRNHLLSIPEYNRDALMQRNFISSHAMIRRQLFDMVGGYRARHSTHEDWDLYRRALQFQWRAARADTHLLYRAHDDSKFYRNIKEKNWQYAQRAHLYHQPITIFTPFAGREALLDKYIDALRKLDFDPQLIQLHCFDTSGNAEFGQRLKDALATLPFGQTTYTSAPHPLSWNHTPESLIKLRMSNERDAQYYYELAVVNAYNHFLSSCDTEFGLTVEDDILLSPGVLKMLLNTVEEDVSAVVVPYRCHMHKYWLVWDNDAAGNIVHPRRREKGIREIGGSGFGCSLFRMSMLKKMPINTWARWEKGQWYDHIAFAHLRKQGRVLCNWDVSIEHVYTERHVDKAQSVSS